VLIHSLGLHLLYLYSVYSPVSQRLMNSANYLDIAALLNIFIAFLLWYFF